MSAISVLTQISIWLLYILIPLLVIYIGYLIITKAFNDMGFSSLEAVIIVFVSFLLGSGLIDDFVGFSFANIPLFTYNQYWQVGINTGGAIIPIILSLYLIYKNKLKIPYILIGISIVAVITYLVTEPRLGTGIVSEFPYFLCPAIGASIVSIIILWKKFSKAAPFAYTVGTLGVLIGADVFHLAELLAYEINENTPAVIGGAVIFDMVFITGILAVIIDGIILYSQKR